MVRGVHTNIPIRSTDKDDKKYIMHQQYIRRYCNSSLLLCVVHYLSLSSTTMPDDMIVGAVADVGAGCDGTAHIRQYRCCWNYHSTTSHIGHAGGIARWCVPMKA